MHAAGRWGAAVGAGVLCCEGGVNWQPPCGDEDYQLCFAWLLVFAVVVDHLPGDCEVVVVLGSCSVSCLCCVLAELFFLLFL